MREVPRSFPFVYKMIILTSGLYFVVGATFFVSALTVLLITGLDYQNWKVSIWVVIFLIWGFALMQYTIASNYRKLRLLIWGKIWFGKMTHRVKSYSDFTGNVMFQCDFFYTYQNNDYRGKILIPEAYELEEGNHYMLLINENHPEKVVCIHQFPRKFKTYFLNQFKSSISLAQRNQNLDTI